MKKLLYLFAAGLLLAASSAQAALNVLACEPEWASLVQHLGGDRVRVTSATHARQDPHHIEARPSLIAQARRAQLLVCTGAELEAGWLPLLQRESGNPAIQNGQPGYVEVARHVELIDKPRPGQRLEGHVHEGGNPHLHLDPRNLQKIGEVLSQRLAQLDPDNAAHYRSQGQAFQTQLREAITRWERDAAPLRGLPVVVQHGSLAYLVRWLGLAVVADLEPKPGIEPSAAHLSSLVQRLKSQPARLILRTPYQSSRPSQWLADRSGITALELPYTVGGSSAAKDLFSLFDDSLSRLKQGL